MADKRKKLKRQVSTDGGFTWTDLIPYEYIAGELIQRDSPDCNNIEWRTVSGYICEENTTEMTQWVADTGYVCVGFNKMNKEKEQVSYNSGISWADTGNTKAGSTLIEANSEDCGYIPPHDYSRDYLTTEALGSGNISLNRVAPGSTRPLLGIQYSKNDGDWESYTYDTNIAVVTGDKIKWKATKNVNNYNELYSYFKATADYKAYGNPLSLLKSDGFVDEPDTIYEYAYYKLFTNNRTLRDASGLALPATTLAKYCYYYMFQGCTKLTAAPSLPATTLADHCYYEMFWNCISLTTAPSLPATTLADYCYDEMFYYCTGLVTAPELPATTLADGCYIRMFKDCKSLTTAPALPATTLVYMCYSNMFQGCTSLTTTPVLPATTLAQQCYNQMFSGCTSLTTAPALPAATLANHCCSQMFWDCTSLTTAPALPSTTLADGCYYEMFAGCTGLTTAPELPAETLVSECYRGMFDGCTSLNYIKCCATNISANLCTYFWARNVASTGTFVKNVSMTSWTTGISGIPSGWTTDTCDCEPDYSTEYLTISSLEDNNEIKWKALVYNGRKTISVSTDNGQTWTAKTSSDTTTGSTLATLNAGDKLLLKGLNSTYSSTDGEPSYFITTKDFSVYGNIMSLIGGDNFANITSFTDANEYAFSHLFWSCSHLVDASNLILPATTLVKECYECMFIDCTSLTTAPALPATTLAEDCYKCMFQGCTSLTSTPALPATTLAMSCYAFMFQGCTRLRTAPALPATTLAEDCYSHMFHSCTRLTTAPVLPATTLTSQCYDRMFSDCRNLNYIKCLATIFASYSTSNWLENVAATGTFVKHSMTDWGRGDSSIPYGWTVVDVPEMTRWVADTGYMCVGTDKYNKEKEQGSNDGGTTWTDTGNIKAGSTLIEANSADCGYSTQYLTTEALNSGNISLNKYTDSGYESKKPITNIQYSKNGGDWTPYTYNTNISVVTGDKIRWKGTFKDGNYYAYKEIYYSYFGATADYNAYGNPLSLLRNDDFVNEPDAIYEGAYYRLFKNSSTLKDVSNLALPAMRLAYFCYKWMFYGCTSLTAAPALPATTLANYCYEDMFYGCTSLTTAPELPATTLAVECYYRMFGRCTSLNYIKCLATNISASNCTYSWVENVASSGTFVKASSMSSWGTGIDGIPKGWTVQDA